MDLFTHTLVGFSLRKTNKVQSGLFTVFSVLGATIPDIGEILIQNALSQKYGESLAVYDSRQTHLPTNQVVIRPNIW